LIVTISPFLGALGSEGPPPAQAKDMELYGWLIGSWEMDTIRPTATEFERVRDRIIFAGSLGKALLSASAGATAA
jgi:hypothetical protein